MKEYIRTTHNFDNKTREWVYRGDKEMDKNEEWENIGITKLMESKQYKYSFGVHALRNNQWMSLEWIVDDTIKMFQGDAAGNTGEFNNFVKNDPNYRWAIKNDVLKELVFLVSIGMVEEREL